jgi:hypothetical protein
MYLFLLLSRQCSRIAHDQNDGISPEKHFVDILIFINCHAACLALSSLARFRKHFLYIFQQADFFMKERGTCSQETLCPPMRSALHLASSSSNHVANAIQVGAYHTAHLSLLLKQNIGGESLDAISVNGFPTNVLIHNAEFYVRGDILIVEASHFLHRWFTTVLYVAVHGLHQVAEKQIKGASVKFQIPNP